MVTWLGRGMTGITTRVRLYDDTANMKTLKFQNRLSHQTPLARCNFIKSSMNFIKIIFKKNIFLKHSN